MKKALYLGLPYHQKTKSNQFVLQMLKEHYAIDEVYQDFLVNDCILEAKEYDYLICWQVMPSRSFINQISYKKAILFPMYDAVVGTTKEMWMDYSDFITINFSKTLHEKLLTYGVQSYYIQYFPEPKKITNWGEQNSLFFWQRIHEVNINLLLKVCSGLDLHHVHIHKALDPEKFFIEPREDLDYTFTYSDWFDDKEEMNELILSSAFYAAPRLYEGIGMSFLEAMAMGRCVVAPNLPTMNEYIEDGKTGFLYDVENAFPISPVDIARIQQNTYQYICDGYEKWTREKSNIIEWIENGTPNTYQPRTEQNLADSVIERKYQRNTSYYLLLNNWLKLRNRKQYIYQLLIKEKIKVIAIYGYSQVAERLIEEFDSSDVEIKYIIDKNVNIKVDKYKTCSFAEPWETVDAIIVTPVHAKIEIIKDIKRRVNYPVYALDDIINFMLRYN